MIGAPTASKSTPTAPKAPATTAAKRKSLTLLPAFAELSKGEVIAQVLQRSKTPQTLLGIETVYSEWKKQNRSKAPQNPYGD
jgi:hypothetical protein